MSRSFPSIVSTRRDAESPVNESVMDDYHDRDEGLVSFPIDTRFEPVTGITAAAFTEQKRIPEFFPAAVGSADSAVQLVVVLEVRVQGTASGRVRVRLGDSGTFVTGATFSSTSWAFQTFTLSSTDTEAAADSQEDLIVEAIRDTGGGTIEVACTNAASRVEAV